MNGGFVAKEADASMQQEIDSKFFTDAIIKLSKKIKTLLLLIKVIEVDNQTIFWNKKTFGDIIRTHKCHVKVNSVACTIAFDGYEKNSKKDLEIEKPSPDVIVKQEVAVRHMWAWSWHEHFSGRFGLYMLKKNYLLI